MKNDEKMDTHFFPKQLNSSKTVIISSIGNDNKIVHISKNIKDITGIYPSDFIGKRFSETFPENPSFFCELKTIESARSGANASCEQVFVNRATGKQYTFLANYFPSFNHDTQKNIITNISVDITEYKETEQKLLKHKADLALAQEIGQMGNWEWNLVNQELYWSKECYRIAELNPETTKLETSTFIDIIHDEDKDYVSSKLATAINEGEYDSFEYRIICPSGGIKHIRVTPKLETDIENRPYRLFGIIQDITAEKEKQKHELEFERNIQKIQKMEALGRLTGGIAHDFNNILACMIGYAQLAELSFKQEKSSELQRYVQEIISAGNRGADLIRQMLAYSRQDDVQLKPIDLDTLVFDVIKMLSAILPASIEINTPIQSNLPKIYANVVEVTQIILNLCLNARDAMQGRGQIDISLTLQTHVMHSCQSCRKQFDGDYIVLSVEDSGEGIADEQLEHIFEPFFTTKPIGKGTGMGLSSVHGLIHRFNGHIIVESEKNLGTCFKLFFPLVTESEKPTVPQKKQNPQLHFEAE